MAWALFTVLGQGLLQGCAAPSPAERAQLVFELASIHRWEPLLVSAGPFDVQAFVPPGFIGARTARLVVYIEGDGQAWVDRSTPAFAPTPADPLALRLALAHNQGLVAYLGRPCQYTHGMAFRHCDPHYWGERRYAPEVIEAMNLAVQRLLNDSGARELVLVGYSGGAVVAALLAARRTDVMAWVTVAGPLDTDAWTQVLGVSPLQGSRNPVTEVRTLSALPQWHFAGLSDAVVPATVLQRFLRAQADAASPVAGVPEVHWLKGFDHTCCWVDAWPRLSRRFSHSDTVCPAQWEPAGGVSDTNR